MAHTLVLSCGGDTAVLSFAPYAPHSSMPMMLNGGGLGSANGVDGGKDINLSRPHLPPVSFSRTFLLARLSVSFFHSKRYTIYSVQNVWNVTPNEPSRASVHGRTRWSRRL